MCTTLNTAKLDLQEGSFNQLSSEGLQFFFHLEIKPVRVSKTATEIIIKNS